MSRARDYIDPRTGETIWFDVKNPVPTDKQLELLSIVERTDIDDLLEEDLSQRAIHDRLHASLREERIPAEVLLRRDEARRQRQHQPPCRKCGKVGDSTKHHFINKWILKELENYQQKWADRSKNTIPLCIDCHREFHSREDGDKSIIPYLNDAERAFAEAALSALAEERPKLLILLARGADEVYVARLVKDWIEGRFKEPVVSEVATESIAA